MEAEFSRTLSDGRTGFPALLEAIEAWLEAHGAAPGAAAQLMIAFDEIISNVLDHGSDGGLPTIDVTLRIAGSIATAEVVDDGPAFDPLSTPPPDTALSLDDRAIGGLGIHLVRELMSELSYRREAGRNRLRFSKDCSLA